jgi:hypothetical protein
LRGRRDHVVTLCSQTGRGTRALSEAYLPIRRECRCVIDDREFYEFAKLLVEKHGEDAEVIAGLKLDEAFDRNDFEECAMWRLILSAIVELRLSKPGPDDPVN